MSIFYRHLLNERYGIAIKVENDQATVALAACAPDDCYSKASARNLLDVRLDPPQSPGLFLINPGLKEKIEGLRFSFTFQGGEPKKDLFFPVVDWVRKEGKKRRRSVSRIFHRLRKFVEDLVENGPRSGGEVIFFSDPGNRDEFWHHERVKRLRGRPFPTFQKVDRNQVWFRRLSDSELKIVRSIASALGGEFQQTPDANGAISTKIKPPKTQEKRLDSPISV